MDSGDVLYIVCNDLRRVSVLNEFGSILIEGREERKRSASLFLKNEMAYRHFGHEEPFLRIEEKLFRKPAFNDTVGDVSYSKRNCRGGVALRSSGFSWFLPFDRLERESSIKADSAGSFNAALATFHYFWIRLYLSS